MKMKKKKKMKNAKNGKNGIDVKLSPVVSQEFNRCSFQQFSTTIPIQSSSFNPVAVLAFNKSEC